METIASRLVEFAGRDASDTDGRNSSASVTKPHGLWF